MKILKNNVIKNLLLYLFIFIVILSIVLLKPINDLDELWNYNFARNIANGLIPYRDFNIIITPLNAIISGIILKITIDQLITMRILAGLLCSLILFIIYKTFNFLKVNNRLTFIFIAVIGYIYHNFLCIDYNWTSLLLTLLIIYLETTLYNKNVLENNMKLDLLIGLLAGLTFTLKQTSGLLICGVTLVNKLLVVHNKYEFKIYLKSFINRVIGILIPILLMAIYLILNNAFYDYINYTIKGASSFTNFISYRYLLKFNIIGVLAIGVPIIIIYELYNILIKSKYTNKYYIFIYGLAIFIVVFPISDNIHFIIGSTPFIILILYEIYNLLYTKLFIKIREKEIIIQILKNIILIIDLIIVVGVCFYTINNYYLYFKNKEYYSNSNKYNSLIINNDLKNKIEEIDNYILKTDKKVLILDASAALYMIPINRYNKDYDMFNKGNFGFKGEERLIQEISNSENTQYLILNDKYNKNWQTPLSIIEYVKNNKTKTGEIEIFDIYE